MDGELLRVDTALTTLPVSPTNSFISTCPLLTPSPPTNDLINPTEESGDTPTFTIGDELAEKLQHVKDDKEGGDSASSSSSALAEPACTQLLNHRNYHHITKSEDVSIHETNGKTQPLQLTFRNPPDYFFMSWNWPLIRKVSLWMFLSGLVAMVALVVAMVWTMPKTCNPETKWYQGSVMYEVFPGSFLDSDNDSIGDLKGLTSKIAYIQSLGIRAVRLNSIFEATEYPEKYKNITSLMKIAKPLGTMKDFNILVNALHAQNISLILDLPIYPYIKKLSGQTDNLINNNNLNIETNDTDHNKPSAEFLKSPQSDEITEAIQFWVRNGVKGFYIKGLEHFVGDDNFRSSLRRWKTIIGTEGCIIISHDVLDSIPSSSKKFLLNNVDLIDVKLNIDDGVSSLTKQLDEIHNGTLFEIPGAPWVHWSLGDESTKRLADRLQYGNATLGASLLQLMLPGTPSIFYGDEIGLQQIHDKHEDRKELAHLHQLGAMAWENVKTTQDNTLPWMHGRPTPSNFEQLNLISKMVQLRANSPSIYMSSIHKDGKTKVNADVKYSQKDMVVIQRWYPRRKSYVVVTNLGLQFISADLSKLLYSGKVVVGPRADSKPETVSFKEINLWPGESVIILLD